MAENSFAKRLKHAWNAFLNRDPPLYTNLGLSSSLRPDRPRLSRGNERSIITSVYNRIAVDCASTSIKHVKLDENGRYTEDKNTGLNRCLTLEANKDQTGRAFIQDVVMSMLDEGCVAIVPVDTEKNPLKGKFDILSMRTGKIREWYPDYVKVRVYNDREGKDEDLLLAKKSIAIIENPLYAIMNEPNSTLQRLIRKLNLLDVIDEQSGSGKLDLIIQLPYAVKTETRKVQAEMRRKDLETQLMDSKYGIAYTDGTEKITQLNRSVDNQLMTQIEYLTTMLYSQLGISEDILKGTADDHAMLVYNTRVIEPILSAVIDEMKRKFITESDRKKNDSIIYFNDPFKLIPVTEIATIADAFTRNEIISTNEVRQIIGLKPSIDPQADELRNKNLYPEGQAGYASTGSEEGVPTDQGEQVDYTSNNPYLDQLFNASGG